MPRVNGSSGTEAGVTELRETQSFGSENKLWSGTPRATSAARFFGLAAIVSSAVSSAEGAAMTAS